jgi:Rrf2 family iron-sulfur cluster assembly transcriptional regulator
MRLSTKGRYAVMAVVDLASRGSDAPVTLAEISERQDISLSYLEQLFAKLRRGGLVRSVRGPGGGYRMSRPAAETRIAEIILAVDEPIPATRCRPGSGRGCMRDGARCLTHDLWDVLGQQIHFFLNSVTVADVIDRKVAGMSPGAAPRELGPEDVLPAGVPPAEALRGRAVGRLEAAE